MIPKLGAVEGVRELNPDDAAEIKGVAVGYMLNRAINDVRTMLSARCDQLGLPADAVDDLVQFCEDLLRFRVEEELEYSSLDDEDDADDEDTV